MRGSPYPREQRSPSHLWDSPQIDQYVRFHLDGLGTLLTDSPRDRCAKMALTDAVTKKGSTPMFNSDAQSMAHRWCESRQYKVARKRHFNRDFSRFEVTNLTDHDDIWILTEKRSQGRRKVKGDSVIHLTLIDARRVKFYRVFGCRNIIGCLIQVERAEYSVVVLRIDWPCDQDHAVGSVNRLFKGLDLRDFKTQPVISSCRFDLSSKRKTIFSPKVSVKH